MAKRDQLGARAYTAPHTLDCVFCRLVQLSLVDCGAYICSNCVYREKQRVCWHWLFIKHYNHPRIKTKALYAQPHDLIMGANRHLKANTTGRTYCAQIYTAYSEITESIRLWVWVCTSSYLSHNGFIIYCDYNNYISDWYSEPNHLVSVRRSYVCTIWEGMSTWWPWIAFWSICVQLL